jgi:hypothetical protein
MAVNLSPVGGVAGQFFDNNGNPLAGGKIFTYAAGTTTNQATYTSASGAIAHSNPIILDGAGRVPSGEIWLTDGLEYKFVIKDSVDALIGTFDNIIGINSNFVNFTNEQEIQTATAGQTVFNLTTMQYQVGTNSLSVFVDGVNQYGPGALYAYVETDSDTVTFTAGLHVGAEVKFTTSNLNSSAGGDAFQVSYTPPFTNSVTTNVGDKLAQTVSVKDFGAVGDGVTDDTAAFIDAIASGAMRIYVPYTGNEYVITNTVSVPRGIIIYGDTLDQPCILCKTAVGGDIVFFSLTGNTQLENLRIYGDSASSGTLVSLTGGTYTFTGNIRLRNVRLYLAKVGLFVNSIFNARIDGCEFRGCTKGIDASPLTDGGDNGYINTLSLFQCYWIGNTDYDVYANPAIRISVLSFADCTFDPGPTVAKVYLSNANPCKFQNCYFEGGSTVPAIKGRLSTITVETSYFTGTKGVEYDNTQANLVMRQCRTTSTDIVNAGFALHIVRITDMTLPASGNVFPDASVRYFDNATINGTAYNLRRNATAYTPVLSGTSTAGTPTYTVQTGRYNVIGNMCFVSGRISITALGSPTGNMQISLPLPAVNIANNFATCVLDCTGVSLSGSNTYFYARTAPNSDQMGLYQGGVTSTQLVAGNFAATATVIWSIAYEIAL